MSRYRVESRADSTLPYSCWDNKREIWISHHSCHADAANVCSALNFMEDEIQKVIALNHSLNSPKLVLQKKAR